MSAADLQRFDEVVATFQPKRLDTLKPEAAAAVGYRGRFRVIWEITEEDGGPYVGQWAFEFCDRGLRQGWVPEEDLEEIELVEGLEEEAECQN
jgi:hypothetical protein